MGKPEIPAAASGPRSLRAEGDEADSSSPPALAGVQASLSGPPSAADLDEDDSLRTVDVPSARSQSVDGILVPAVLSQDGIPSNPAPPAARGDSARAASGSPATSRAEGQPAGGEYPVSDWDRYEFLGLLGQGGMGAVYKARDRRLRRIVALKFIRGGDDRLTQRFMQEARAQSRIDHPGVCKVLEVGDVEGKFYIAMQFVDGLSLQQVKLELSLPEKVSIIKEAAEALHAAHDLGIIHRDIKPANIMVERQMDGAYHPVIMDFGLARDTNDGQGMTESGTVMGTAAFMSPEQARGNAKSLDRRSDVYSLGATLFDLIAGRPPFVADSMADTLLKVMLEEPPTLRQLAPEAPEALDVIVGKCLNKEANQRYASAGALAEDLSRFLGNRRIVGKRLSLYRRLRWRAQNNKPAAIGVLGLCLALLTLFVYGIRTRVQTLARERQARQQAELAQRLGQEIKDMEWMLRSARQLPLHDLNREKRIMRSRMRALQTELQGYGELGRSLGYYALGRGHMALHEYTDALEQLYQAKAAGNDGPEVQYALGFVLGKHYEQAMAEARLAGGGEWAKKQLKDIEPKYLAPAIAALQSSRGVKLDAAAYLEGLIAYYRGDYDIATKRAEEALQAAPWLYEGHKLVGDVHLQRGLRAWDRADMVEADAELGRAVTEFERAAQIGQSDAEVYESLTDAWVQRVAVAQIRQKGVKEAYAATLVAADKIAAAEPQSIASPLKKAYAVYWRVFAQDPSDSLADLSKTCQHYVGLILKKEPAHPYAINILSTCLNSEAQEQYNNHKDPIPNIERSIAILQPVMAQRKMFLDGSRSLAVRYQYLAQHLQRRGAPQTRKTFEMALGQLDRTREIDASDISSVGVTFEVLSALIPFASTVNELKQYIARAERELKVCLQLAGENFACYVNYLTVNAAGAERADSIGEAPTDFLKNAEKALVFIKKQSEDAVELQQSLALARLVLARQQQQQGQDPSPALAELGTAVERCLAQKADDPSCYLLAAQAAWVRAAWLAEAPAKALTALKEGLRQATAATEHSIVYPEAWQTLAESNLRLAQASKPRSKAAEGYLQAASAALAKQFSMNPHLPLGHLTAGELHLYRAEQSRGRAQQEAVTEALRSFALAAQNDKLLARRVARLQSRAKELQESP
jgi:tRNA A-37 threonylcarbamoyl transferase component Bud32